MSVPELRMSELSLIEWNEKKSIRAGSGVQVGRETGWLLQGG